jgi:hypothetical protein
VRGEVPSKKVYEVDEIFASRHLAAGAGAFHVGAEKAHRIAADAARDAGVLGRMRRSPEGPRAGLEGFLTIINSGRIGRQDDASAYACQAANLGAAPKPNVEGDPSWAD